MNHRYGKISTLGKGSCKDKKIRTQIRLCLGKGFCICKGKKKSKQVWHREEIDVA
jgi:ribulose bisphosphate carboxylase small subunit